MTRAWATAVLAVGVLAGCDSDRDGIIVSPGRLEVDGFWTGHAEITPIGSVRGSFEDATGLGFGDGFEFPVALGLLEFPRRFTLWTSGFDVSATGGVATGDQRCDGVWALRGWTLELFPDRACRALPLHRYTIGRVLPDGMTLEGRADATRVGIVNTSAPDFRIRIVLRRDRR